MKKFCFTVDDNIRCLKELTYGNYGSIFEHPYLNVYKRLHEKYGLKVQLNLFYEVEGFDLSDMTDRYKNEWQANSDWLKLSFHSRVENVKPYELSEYDEVYGDCQNVQREIVRFASSSALGRTTTLHYCRATHKGIQALKDNGVEGLLGLYGKEDSPRASYQNTAEECSLIRRGEIVSKSGISYAGIDIVLNACTTEEILSQLNELKHRDFTKVMIHEQYFYPDYPYYQKDFEEKLSATFGFLTESGFSSIFFEECLLGRKKAVHNMKLNSVPYAMIKKGQKTIELRLFDEKRQQIKAGDTITFTNTSTGEMLNTTVVKLHCFNDFDELYRSLPLLQCGYTAENIDKAHHSDMEQYYSVEQQTKHGVVGIELCRPKQITG